MGSQAIYRNLGPDERAVLERGETIIRKARGEADCALARDGGTADLVLDKISSLRPNYVTEVFSVSGGSSLEEASRKVAALAAALSDVESYIGIPYHSKQHNMVFELFDRIEVIDRSKARDGESIEAIQHMMPFEDFRARYRFLAPPPPGPLAAGIVPLLLFTCENTSSILYRGIGAVAPGHMLWFLYVFHSGGQTYFYGVGAVRAWDFFGALRGRLEISFMGRIEAFMTHMRTRLR